MRTLTALLVAMLVLSASPASAYCNGADQDRCDAQCAGMGGPGILMLAMCSKQMVVATGENYTKCSCEFVYDPDFQPPSPVTPDQWCLTYPADPICYCINHPEEPSCLHPLVWVYQPNGTFKAEVEVILPNVAPEE